MRSVLVCGCIALFCLGNAPSVGFSQLGGLGVGGGGGKGPGGGGQSGGGQGRGGQGGSPRGGANMGGNGGANNGGGRPSLGRVGGGGARSNNLGIPSNPIQNNPGLNRANPAGQGGLGAVGGLGVPRANVPGANGAPGNNQNGLTTRGAGPDLTDQLRRNPTVNRATQAPAQANSSNPIDRSRGNNDVRGNNDTRGNNGIGRNQGEANRNNPLNTNPLGLPNLNNPLDVRNRNNDMRRPGDNTTRPSFGNVDRLGSGVYQANRVPGNDQTPGNDRRGDGNRRDGDRTGGDRIGNDRNRANNGLESLLPWNTRPGIGGNPFNNQNDRRDYTGNRGDREGRDWNGRGRGNDWNNDWRNNRNYIGNRPSWARPNYTGPGGAYANWNQNGWGWGNNNVNNWQSQWYNNGVHQHYHGWYNGGWNSNWGSNWYAPVVWGGLGWGLGSWATNYGYGNAYANPYYGTGYGYSGQLPYNYAQPVVIAAYGYNDNAQDPGVEVTSNSAAYSESPESEKALVEFDQGLRDFKAANYSGALVHFDTALKGRPNDPVIHEVRALTLFAQGSYLESAITLNSLLAAAPGMDWTTMSGLYGNVDNYTQQLRALEKHCREKKDDAAAYFVLAYHYLVIDAKADAMRTLQVVVKNEPNDVTAKRMLDALQGNKSGEALPNPNVASINNAERTGKVEGSEPQDDPAVRPQVAASVEDDSSPKTQTDLVGTWQAKAEDSTINLTIQEDSKFTWRAEGGSEKAVAIDGKVMTSPNVVVFESPTQGVMSGTVKSEGENSWEFTLDGAPPNVPGLKFVRK